MMFSVRRWPIASSRVQPKRVSAPGLHSVIRPVSSRVTTASSAESMIPRRRASDAWSWSWTVRRATNPPIWSATALSQLPRPARGEPCVETGTVGLPGLAHVHHVPRGVDAPEHRRVPAEALAEGAEDLLPHVAVPARTGDDAGHGMDRLEMTLGARALGDVDRESDDAVRLALRVAQRRVVHVERRAAEI